MMLPLHRHVDGQFGDTLPPNLTHSKCEWTESNCREHPNLLAVYSLHMQGAPFLAC